MGEGGVVEVGFRDLEDEVEGVEDEGGKGFEGAGEVGVGVGGREVVEGAGLGGGGEEVGDGYSYRLKLFI